MNLPQVYTCSPSWSPLPPPSPYHPFGSSQCTSLKHPVSCIKPIDYAKAFDCVDHNKLGKILKDIVFKVLHTICQQIWKTQQWPKDWKRSVFVAIQKKGNAKECSNCSTMALISHTGKGMLKCHQVRLHQFVNWELPDMQAGFSKDSGTGDEIANNHCIIEKAREF